LRAKRPRALVVSELPEVATRPSSASGCQRGAALASAAVSPSAVLPAATGSSAITGKDRERAIRKGRNAGFMSFSSGFTGASLDPSAHERHFSRGFARRERARRFAPSRHRPLEQARERRAGRQHAVGAAALAQSRLAEGGGEVGMAGAEQQRRL